MKNARMAYVEIPLDRDFLARIVADGRKNQRSRVRQILYVLQEWYGSQEEARTVVTKIVGVGKGRTEIHEQRRKAS